MVARRPLIFAGAMALIGVEPARAQVTPDQIRKFEAWVEFTNRDPETNPMTNGTLLGFSSEQVRRKQVGVTRDGFSNLFAVVIPAEQDGIILAAGRAEARTFGVHRTGTHLRRVASARNVNRVVSKWDGEECERDFQEQVAFWLNRPVN